MSTRYKRTDWVRRLEEYSSGCSSGFRLGQWLIAGILAIFTGISRLLPVTRWLSVTLSPDVPVVSTVGIGSLKSPTSIWRGVVFVVLVVFVFLFPMQAYSKASCWCKISDGQNAASFKTWNLDTYTDWERAWKPVHEWCASDCVNKTSDYLSNYERLCAEVIQQTYGASLTIGAFSDVGAGNYHQSDGKVGSDFPGCTNECLVKSTGESECKTYPKGQKPEPLFDYPPSIDGNDGTILCKGNSKDVKLTANPSAPNEYHVQWYLNGVLLPNEVSQSIHITDKGGRYQASYVNGNSNLGKSSVVVVQQCIQGIVWHDVNANGGYDNEPLLKDIKVQCATNNSVQFAMTDENGYYAFPNVTEGGLIFPVGIPQGTKITKPQPQTNYTSTGNGLITDFDFGLQLPASVSGQVWHDSNCDGDSTDESGLNDWLVEYDDGFQFSEFTNSDGNYKIEGLHYPNGSYTLKPIVTAGYGWIPTSPASGTYSSTLSKFQTVTGIDFGYKQLVLDIQDKNVWPFELWDDELKEPKPYTLPTPAPTIGTAGGSYKWYKGDSQGPQSDVITETSSEGTYWLEYSEPDSECSVLTSFQLLVKPLQASWHNKGYYCIYGTADNQNYSWKLEGVDKQLQADPVSPLIDLDGDGFPGTKKDLAIAFKNSINEKLNENGITDITAEIGPAKVLPWDEDLTHCFSIKDSSDPGKTFNLYVGNALEEPTCKVNTSTSCAYNPDIINIVSDGQCILPPHGTVAWYSFEGEDSTGANNPIYVEGKSGKAASFIETSYIEIPHSTRLNFGQSNFSISAWIKTSQTDFGYILSKEYRGSSKKGYEFYLSQGKLGIQLADGNGIGGCSMGTSAPCTDYISNTVVADGKWHLVVVTVDRNNTEGGKFYVDGLEVDTFNPTLINGSLNSDVSLILGGNFQGELDEISLVQGILSADDIAGFYQADSAGLCEIPESLSSSTNSLSVTPTSQDVPATNGSFTFDIANTGNGIMNWTVQTDASWLIIRSASGTNDGTITVNYTANTGDARTGTITVTADGAENNPQTVEVKQAAKIEVNELSVTLTSQDISATNGSFTFDIANAGNGTMEWTAQTDVDWLTINSASGTNNGTITVNYTANSDDERTGTITVVAPGAENSPQTVTVKQESSPLPKWDGTLEGYKFIDTNNNGEYDETSETLVEGRHYIVMKPLSYSGSPFGALADNGHYKFYNVKNGSYSMWQHVDGGWLADNLTTEAEIKWSSDDPLTVSVSNDGIRIDGNDQLLEKIDFPIPDFANKSGNVIPPEVKDKITAECEDVDYVLCGSNSDDCPSNTSATVINLTTGEWPTTGAYSDMDVFAYKKISTFGTIYLPLSGNNQNVTVGSICNYGTLTLKEYYHPVVMDFNYWFINYGKVLGASGIPNWYVQFTQAASIERIEIRSKTSWGLTGSFYNEGTIQGGNGKRFNYTNGYLRPKTRIENKELIGFPQLNDLLQLNELSIFKVDHPDAHPCNDEGYTDGKLADGQSYNYVVFTAEPEMPDGAALSSLHKEECYDYTNQGSIADSLEPEHALSTGGDVRIEAANIYQNGEILAGQGIGMNFQNKDEVPDYFNKLRFGGKGGDTTLRSTNMVFTKDSSTHAGKGGDITVEEGCLDCVNIEVKGGQGGDLTIDPAGDESEISIYGELEGDSIYVEPDLMLAGKDTNIIARKDVVIFGGDNWKLVLNDLRDDAIVAGRDITIAVGDGGTVDLRGNTSKVFKAGGKVAIYADNVLLDQGVQLEDIIQASEIVRGPNKIIYRVVLDTQDVQGKANETIPVKLEVSNAGPKTDTYTLSATSKKGIAISGLPSSITIEGLTRKQLDLSVILPAEGSDTITITATSQADSTVVATARIRATVAQETTAEFSISTISGVAPLTVDLDASASVANGSIVSYKWTASDGQTAEGQNAQLTFHEVGDYTITLEVMDDREASDSVAKNVKVEAAAKYAASGTIKDNEGNPLPGVTIQIGDKTVVTDATGYWEITGLAEDEYTVTASKEGYRFDSKTCVFSDNQEVCHPFKPESLLDVKVVPEPRIAKQGENVTYTITVTNQGEGTATGVTLVEGLPDNTDLVSIESLDGGSCEAETLTCRLPNLTPGATANVKVVVSNSNAKTLINTVMVTTQQYPTDVKKTWTRVIPYLSVTVTDLPDPIEMLKVLHYNVALELSHYAPTDATGITLVSQLPFGVELKSINSDYANCDSSAFPQITCEMNDLSIASADSVSQATVEMDVELKDAGLLLLTHQAKVTASEYPAHSVRTRTTVFVPEDIQVDLALVIDVTGSMQEEMNGVIKALTKFIGEIDTSTAPLMALLTFSDEVKVAAFTQDLTVLRGAIEDLTASGGGLCEEASIEALLVAIPHVKTGADILFATDASPYDDADVEKVIELLRGKGIRFNAMITGDCSMPESWNELP